MKTPLSYVVILVASVMLTSWGMYNAFQAQAEREATEKAFTQWAISFGTATQSVTKSLSESCVGQTDGDKVRIKCWHNTIRADASCFDLCGGRARSTTKFEKIEGAVYDVWTDGKKIGIQTRGEHSINFECRQLCGEQAEFAHGRWQMNF